MISKEDSKFSHAFLSSRALFERATVPNTAENVAIVVDRRSLGACGQSVALCCINVTSEPTKQRARSSIPPKVEGPAPQNGGLASGIFLEPNIQVGAIENVDDSREEFGKVLVAVLSQTPSVRAARIKLHALIETDSKHNVAVGRTDRERGVVLRRL